MAIKKILQADIVRMQATKPENTSLAAAYFKQRPMLNSTHIAAAKIKKETGNIPVVGRGGPGVRPKHGAETMLIEPMPIEIDDTISAVELDNYERATELGKNQIIDEYTGEHYDMVRETMNALCCQAHHGKIDYMMKTENGLQRYVVEYGTAAEIAAMTISFGKKLSVLKYGDAVNFLSKLAQRVKANGVGGPVEFIAAGDVFSTFVELANKNNANNAIDGEFVKIGKFKVYEDNDSYIDFDSSGNKIAKSLCAPGTICCRALNAGQSMPFLKIDDTVQRNAVPFYSFTVERNDHRGTDIYSKSKPFPIVNTKGIAWGSFEAETVKVTFSAGSNGSIAATVDGESISSGDSVPTGKTVVFTATPASGYQVDAWTGEGLADAGANAKSVELGTSNFTASVTFKTV